MKTRYHVGIIAAIIGLACVLRLDAGPNRPSGGGGGGTTYTGGNGIAVTGSEISLSNSLPNVDGNALTNLSAASVVGLPYGEWPATNGACFWFRPQDVAAQVAVGATNVAWVSAFRQVTLTNSPSVTAPTFVQDSGIAYLNFSSNGLFADSISVAQPNTVVAVAKWSNQGPAGYVIDGSASRQIIDYNDNSIAGVQMWAGGASVLGTSTQSTNWMMVTAVFNGQNSWLATNAVWIGTNFNVGANGLSRLVLGKFQGGAASAPGMQLLELQIYPYALTSNQNVSLWNAITNKYKGTIRIP